MKRPLSIEAKRLSDLHRGSSLAASGVLFVLAWYSLDNAAAIAAEGPTTVGEVAQDFARFLPTEVGGLDARTAFPLAYLALGLAVNDTSRGARPLGMYLATLLVATIVLIDASILDWTGLIGERTGRPTLISFEQVAVAVALPAFALAANLFALSARQLAKLDERDFLGEDLVRLHAVQLREALRVTGEAAVLGIFVGAASVVGVRSTAGVDLGLDDNAALVGGLIAFVVAFLLGRALVKRTVHN